MAYNEIIPEGNQAGKSRKGGKMETMTDYQFKSIIKMVLDIVTKSKDKDEIRKALEELLNDEKKQE